MPNAWDASDATTFLRYSGAVLVSSLDSHSPNGGDRPAELERRLARLEAAVFGPHGDGPRPPAAGAEEPLWALAALKARTAGSSAVLFTGHVTLEDAATHEWQQGADTDGLLAMDVEDAASTLAALGHPVRLRLLQAVLSGQTTVAELGSMNGLGTSGQLYHHLRELQAAGWLHSAGRGRYHVPPARVVPLLTVLATTQR